MSTNACISPLFTNWVEEKTGQATIDVNNGAALISAAIGEAATLYYPIVLYPGDSIEFNVSVFASSIAAVAFIFEDSPGSGFGNTSTVTTTKGMEEVSLKHTVSLDSDGPKYVFVKVGLDSSVAGSLTAVNPRIKITRDSIGGTRTLAIGNLLVSGGAATINDKWTHAGIANLAINGGLLEVTLDRTAVTTSLSYQTKALPHFTVNTGFGTANNLICRPKSYDQFSRVFGIEFIDVTTGLPVDAATITNARVLFEAKII